MCESAYERVKVRVCVCVCVCECVSICESAYERVKAFVLHTADESHVLILSLRLYTHIYMLVSTYEC